MHAPVTALYAGLLALLFVALSLRISLYRMKHHVGIGDGGHAELARAIRVQGNAAEYIPLALILLLVNELNGQPAWFLHIAGAAFFVARLLHAAGLGRSAGRTPGRFNGTGISWLVIVALAVALLIDVLT